jgi:glucose-6-phosphate isomerase
MDAMQRLVQDDAVRRLWERDTTLFTDDPACAGVVANRLGWLGLASAEDPIGDDIRRLAADAVAEGVRDIVLLGMGGSSLAPLVVSRILATGPEHPHLHVLDTTAPATVRATLDEIAAESTWVIVASKSGTTIEPLALYAVFRQWMERRLVAEGAGRAFVAITDTGTPLESLAREQGFRAVLSAPADVADASRRSRRSASPRRCSSASTSRHCWTRRARWRRRAANLRSRTLQPHSRLSPSASSPAGATSSRWSPRPS